MKRQELPPAAATVHRTGAHGARQRAVAVCWGRLALASALALVCIGLLPPPASAEGPRSVPFNLADGRVGGLKLATALLSGGAAKSDNRGTGLEHLARRRYKLRRCGSLPITTEGVRGRTRVAARGFRCAFARRTIRRSTSRGMTPRGWICIGSGEGSFCAPGRTERVTRLANSPQLHPLRRHVTSDNTRQTADKSNTVGRCRGAVGYGTSKIRVLRTRGVPCRTARQLARAAVIYRVNSGFPKRFCNGGYCWRFGDPKGVRPGQSRLPLRGRRGPRRIVAVQSVS